MSARFRYFFFTFCAFAAFLPSPGRAQQSGTNAAPAAAQPKTGTPTTPTSASTQMVAAAIELMKTDDVDGALSKLSEAIRLNPRDSGAYVLRASIYCQKKLWSQADADFRSAQQLAPTNVVLKFQIVEVKFLQKQFDAARPGYLALESDPDMGDFASYKVFLCDLAGGHEAAAKKELDAFDKADGNPSYYFGNAAWSIFHKKFDDARNWLGSASRIYPPRQSAYYAESLVYLGYLPLPQSVPLAPSGAAGH
jgi:tetratricopeptide (TPR) repeat protein